MKVRGIYVAIAVILLSICYVILSSWADTGFGQWKEEWECLESPADCTTKNPNYSGEPVHFPDECYKCKEHKIIGGTTFCIDEEYTYKTECTKKVKVWVRA